MPFDPDYCTVPNANLGELRDMIAGAFGIDELDELITINFGESMYRAMATRGVPDNIAILQMLEALGRYGTIVVLLRAVRKARIQRADLIAFIRQLCPAAMNEAPSPNGPVGNVVTALHALKARASEPGIAEPLGASRDKLLSLAGDLRNLKGYKALHDGLQSIQVLLFGADFKRAVTDPMLLSMLESTISACRMTIRNLDEGASLLPNAPLGRGREAGWIASLTSALQKLSTATAVLDYQGGAMAMNTIRGIMRREPPRINGEMTGIVEGLPIDLLTRAIKDVTDRLGNQDEASAVLNDACVGLQNLSPRLRGQVVQHNRWQEIENELAAADQDIERGSADSMEGFMLHWVSAEPLISALWKAEPDATWVSNSQRLHATFSTMLPAAPAAASNDARYSYGRFRRAALEQFFAVDHDLVILCGAVIEVGKPLDDLLKRIGNEP